MIASCYRRMNLFNDALRVYEDIQAEYPDNPDCLRGLVQIRKELGMKYQHLQEKLMIIDREEEMKRNYMQQNYGQQDYYGGGGGGMPQQQQQYDLNEMRQAVGDVPDMSHIQPKAKTKMAGNAGGGNVDDDDGGWGNTADLLE